MKKRSEIFNFLFIGLLLSLFNFSVSIIPVTKLAGAILIFVACFNMYKHVNKPIYMVAGILFFVNVAVIMIEGILPVETVELTAAIEALSTRDDPTVIADTLKILIKVLESAMLNTIIFTIVSAIITAASYITLGIAFFDGSELSNKLRKQLIVCGCTNVSAFLTPFILTTSLNIMKELTKFYSSSSELDVASIMPNIVIILSLSFVLLAFGIVELVFMIKAILTSNNLKNEWTKTEEKEKMLEKEKADYSVETKEADDYSVE